MTVAVALPRVTVSAIVTQTAAILRRRAPDIGALAAVLAIAPRILLQVVPASDRGVLALVSNVLTVLMLAALAQVTGAEFIGQRLGAQAAASAGSSRIGALLLLTLLSGLAQLAAALLLVLPGLFLFVCWMPATAVCVLEKRSATASLGRAWRLTDGHRWTLAAVALIFFAIAAALITGSLFASVVMREAGDRELPSRLVAAALVGVASGTVYAVAGVGGAVIYVLLRTGKEGLPTGVVAAVFD